MARPRKYGEIELDFLRDLILLFIGETQREEPLGIGAPTAEIQRKLGRHVLFMESLKWITAYMKTDDDGTPMYFVSGITSACLDWVADVAAPISFYGSKQDPDSWIHEWCKRNRVTITNKVELPGSSLTTATPK